MSNMISKYIDFHLGRLCVNLRYLQLLSLIISLIIITSIVAIPAIAEDSNTIIVGGSYDYPPYSYLDDSGKPTGFSVELSEAISKVLHKQIELKMTAWSQVRSNLENGRIDYIHDIVYSDERSKMYSFSKPYHISPYTVFRKTDSPQINSINDLNGKKVVVIKGDIGEDYLREQSIHADVQVFNNYSDVFKFLENSDYQYALMDELVGLYWLKNLKLQDIERTELSLFKTKYCYAASLDDPEKSLEIDGAISVLIKNGQYEAIFSKWMTNLKPNSITLWEVVQKYYYYIIALAILAIILFLWTVVLRRKVEAKTEDLKSAMDTLELSKNRFKALLNVNPDMMFLFGKDRTFLDYHGGSENLLSDPKDFIDKSIWDVLPKELADQTDTMLQRVFYTGDMQIYEYQLEIGGNELYYESRLVLCDEQSAMSIVRNITDSKNSEIMLNRQNQELEAQYEEYMQLNEMLKQSNLDLEEAKAKAEAGEKELLSLMTNLPGMVYRCLNDNNWSMKFVSEGALSLTGYYPEDLIDNNIVDYNSLIHPDDRDLVRKAVDDGLSSQMHYVVDYRIITKDGVVKYVWERGHALLDDNGEFYMLQGFITDITDRKIAEDTLQRQNQDLEAQYEEYLQLNEMLRRTNYELEIAKAKAEESDKLKTAFLQNMSHEIRTPLNGIIGYTSLLNNRDILREEIEEYSTIIQNSGNRLIEIVNNILDISKIETGQIELQTAVLSVNSLIRDAHSFFLHSAKKKNIELICYCELEDSNSMIRSDELRLNQILTNLISNALKFTQKGRIEFGYKIEYNWIVFYVKDSGIGISEEYKDKVFERFTQVDLSISRGYEGAGLGLSISKGLVQLLGGKIWLESQPGIGTQFYFAVPFIPVEEMSLANNTLSSKFYSSELVQNGYKVLVVEDDETSRDLITLVLKRFCREILYAGNGIDAVTLAKQNPNLDLIFMDIKMPIMNGIDATRLIREFNKDVVIIAQTAYAFSSESEMIKAAGCNEYMAKPIEINKLKRILNGYKHLNNAVQV